MLLKITINAKCGCRSRPIDTQKHCDVCASGTQSFRDSCAHHHASRTHTYTHTIWRRMQKLQTHTFTTSCGAVGPLNWLVLIRMHHTICLEFTRSHSRCQCNETFESKHLQILLLAIDKLSIWAKTTARQSLRHSHMAHSNGCFRCADGPNHEDIKRQRRNRASINILCVVIVSRWDGSSCGDECVLMFCVAGFCSKSASERKINDTCPSCTSPH